MKQYFLPEHNIEKLLNKWASEGLFGTVQRNERTALAEIRTAEDVKSVTLRKERAYSSAKPLLFPARERVAVYSTTRGGEDSETRQEPQTKIILGVRNCDLTAIALMDKLFMEGDYKDPFYTERRNHLIIVSNDCVRAAESCFCNLVGVEPYPVVGFDINLSPLQSGYAVEAGTQRGQDLLEESRQLLKDVTPAQLAERDDLRKEMKAHLTAQNKEYEPKRPIEELLKGGIDGEVWKEFASCCVECGACSNICPTCHCFFMYDQECASCPVGKMGEKLARKAGSKYERMRSWDSCLYADFARMAGAGAKPNPRPEIRSRVENRFSHKFLYQLENYGRLGCTGCGRCIEACLGGIDPRKVIRALGKSKEK